MGGNYADIVKWTGYVLPWVVVIIMPLIVELLKQPQLQKFKIGNTSINTYLSFGLSFLIAIGTLMISDKISMVHGVTPQNLLSDTGLMMTGAIGVYQFFFKDSKLQKALSKIEFLSMFGVTGDAALPESTDNGVKPEDPEQDVSQDPNVDYSDESVEEA